MKKNKWLMALAGMTVQLSIGSIYAYSVWMKPIGQLAHWDAHQLKLAFSLAICFLGLTAAFMGRFVQRIGPTKSGFLSALFFGVGLSGAGVAASIHSLPLFYVFYGIVSGIGLGFGYITPVSVVVKWFPERPGFASGLVIMSFTAGSILASQIISPLARDVGVPAAFYTLAGIYAFLMILASLYLQVPEGAVVSKKAATEKTITVAALLADPRFYSFWLMLFLNTTCGIALIAVAAPMAKEVIHISEQSAILFVGLIGLFNGLGRLGWSSVSDKIGRWNTYAAFFLIGAFSFLLLAQTTNAYLFEALVFVIISCYGGAFATMPAFLKDVYGPDQMGPIFGYVLTAWAAAAFAGPWLITLINNYAVIFHLFACLLLIAFGVSFLLRRQSKASSLALG